MRLQRSVVVLTLGVSLFAAVPALAVTRVRTSAELQAAFRSVPDGGIIEAEAGTYVAPSNGFSIANLRKAFTVRAKAGAVVRLDGQNQRAILRYKNGDRSRGKRVTFQDIIFQNGRTTAGTDAGGITMVAAEARFERCAFLSNSSATTGGGAVRVFSNSAATFVTSNFGGNSSARNGGAIAVVFSSVTLQRCGFSDNRTNLAGHNPHSSGGAIHVQDGTLQITNSLFKRNEAGWTGGAVYAFGTWTNPVTTPKADVTIVKSTFMANKAVPNACCGVADPTTGGAVHIEDQTRLRIFASQFLDNVADFGGAIDSYRAEVEISGSELRRNRAPAVAGRIGFGGAIASISNDSAGDHGLDRRPARLVVSDSLLQGGLTPPAAVAQSGGCIAAEGDWARLYGQGIPAAGTAAENRSRVELRRVAFADCDVEKSAAGGGDGGAILATLVDLLLDGSLIVDSDARGTNASGGGIEIQRESTAVVSGTTFARDTAQRQGGAIQLSGSTAQISSCRFFQNQANDWRGASLFTTPQLGSLGQRNVGGAVTGSLFSEDNGLSIFDLQPQSGTLNQMRYRDNRFFTTPVDGLVYLHTQLAPSGVTASQLDALPVSDGGNVALFSLPIEGALIAAPPGLGAGAPLPPPATAPTPTVLAFAWSGHSASLIGQGLAERTGLLPIGTVGIHTLLVDGTPVAAAQVAASACTAGPTLCLRRSRFQVAVRWRGADGKTGDARAVSLSEDAGYFWIASEAEPSLIVQIREDGGVSFFRGAQAANVGFTVTLTDSITGAVRSWSDDMR